MELMSNIQNRKKLCSPLDALPNNNNPIVISREATNDKSTSNLERSHTMSLQKDQEVSTNEAPLLPEDKEYHAFFSYQHANHDRNWVKAVIRELENRGFRCCVYEKDRIQSKSYSSNIQHFIDKSMRIVTVLSNAYIEGEWSKLEMEVLSGGNANELVFIPVLIEPCAIPPSLKDCVYVNATCKQVQWWEHFLELLRGTCPPLPPKKKFYAFFAHGPKDKQLVVDVVKMLESPKVGIVCSYPSRTYKNGQSKRDGIDNAIRRSAKVVLIVSEQFVNFEWKKYYENKLANKDIIPVIIEDTFVPASLNDCETIDARSDENHWLPSLLAAITDSG